MAAKALAALTRYNDIQILSSTEVYNILNAYKIPLADWRVASTAAEVAKVAAEIGFPVVIKAEAEEIVHKSDVGGVVVNLQDAASSKSAAEKMAGKLKAKELKFLVQKHMPKGEEVIVGAKAEIGLGHMVMFGMGGVLVELLKDVSFELTPVTAFEAKKMLTSIKCYPLLAGFRGKKGVNQDMLIETIQRLSQLVTNHPVIQELDLNPIIAYETRICVVDARIGL